MSPIAVDETDVDASPVGNLIAAGRRLPQRQVKAVAFRHRVSKYTTFTPAS